LSLNAESTTDQTTVGAYYSEKRPRTTPAGNIRYVAIFRLPAAVCAAIGGLPTEKTPPLSAAVHRQRETVSNKAKDGVRHGDLNAKDGHLTLHRRDCAYTKDLQELHSIATTSTGKTINGLLGWGRRGVWARGIAARDHQGITTTWQYHGDRDRDDRPPTDDFRRQQTAYRFAQDYRFNRRCWHIQLVSTGDKAGGDVGPRPVKRGAGPVVWPREADLVRTGPENDRSKQGAGNAAVFYNDVKDAALVLFVLSTIRRPGPLRAAAGNAGNAKVKGGKEIESGNTDLASCSTRHIRGVIL